MGALTEVCKKRYIPGIELHHLELALTGFIQTPLFFNSPPEAPFELKVAPAELGLLGCPLAVFWLALRTIVFWFL